MIINCLPSYAILENDTYLTWCVKCEITLIYNESILYICCVVKPTKTIDCDNHFWVWEL